MPKGKPGAAFERLGAAVHKKLDPGAEVRWNERINGVQVDGTVRGTVGGHKLLVIIECRDYSEVLDVDHVRRLVSVRTETGADKAILVTRTGFTRGAFRLAEKERIETCVLGPATVSPPGTVPLEALHLTLTVQGDSVEEVEVALEDGRKLRSSAMAQIQGTEGQEFIDRFVKSCMPTEGRGPPRRIEIVFESPLPRLLRDEEEPPIKALRYTTRATEWHAFSGLLWKAPQDWIFVRQRTSGPEDEPTFFQFSELELLAEGLVPAPASVAMKEAVTKKPAAKKPAAKKPAAKKPAAKKPAAKKPAAKQPAGVWANQTKNPTSTTNPKDNPA